MSREGNDYVIVRFAALCFFLSTVEFMIPKPLPFLRIGLANMPIMLACELLPFGPFLLLVALKAAAQGIVSGTLFSYIFLLSVGGSLASALVMYAARAAFPRALSFVGVSVLGAFASNAAQLALAGLVVFGEGMALAAPPVLALGLVTGTLLGFAVNRFSARSSWLADLRSGRVPEPAAPPADATVPVDGNSAAAGAAGGNSAVTARARVVPPVGKLALAACLAFFLLFFESPWIKLAAATLAGLLLLLGGGKIKLPPVLSASFGIVAFHLFIPFGKVLAEPFGLPITQGALETGIKKALAVEGLIFISRWALSGGIPLPGRAGKLISRMIAFLGYLVRSRPLIDRSNLIASLDRVMYGRG
jgi:uncharacterized membrane protein